MIFPVQQLSTTPEIPMPSQLEYIEAAWDKVADEREADIAARRAHWIPGDEAMQQLRARLKP